MALDLALDDIRSQLKETEAVEALVAAYVSIGIRS